MFFNIHVNTDIIYALFSLNVIDTENTMFLMNIIIFTEL